MGAENPQICRARDAFRRPHPAGRLVDLNSNIVFPGGDMKFRAFRLFTILLVATTFAAAQIPATDDGYTASSSASGNFGNQSMLNVIGPGVNSYIRFDLTALPSGLTSSNVSKATVRLNINGVTTAGSFDVYLVTGAWSEGAITFGNAPALGTKVASAINVALPKRNFIDVDVTSAVQAWLASPNSSPNYGIALVPSSGSSISVAFDSKENTSTSHDPELYVALVSAGPQGPKGDKGDIGPQGLQGVQGPQGPEGKAGITPSVVVGSTTTMPAGFPASVQEVVTVTPTSSVANLNFLIPQGPPGPGGFSGMQIFSNPNDIDPQSYQWKAPAGVTHVMVEMWGAGGGGGPADPTSGCFGYGGGGGAYSRSVVPVTAGTTYTIVVGGGGQNNQAGGKSTMDGGGQTLITAGGGGACIDGGNPDPNAALSKRGAFTLGTSGGTGGNAFLSPGPDSEQTGRGANWADLSGHAFAGFVLLTW